MAASTPTPSGYPGEAATTAVTEAEGSSVWEHGAVKHRRKGSKILLSDAHVSFETWSKDGKLTQCCLRECVIALKDAVFMDNMAHPGWVDYKVASIRVKYLENKDYLSESEFKEILDNVTSFDHGEGAKDIVILGGGAFGTGMSVAIAGGGHRVRILITSSRRTKEQLQKVADSINIDRVYPSSTPEERKIASQLPKDYHFPPNVTAFIDAEQALKGVHYVMSAIPCQATYNTIKMYKDLIPEGIPVITLSKGIASNKYIGMSTTEAAAKVASGIKESDLPRDPTYLMTMDECLALALGEGRNPVAGIAGPSFAKQLCQMEQSACTVACSDEGVARQIAVDLSTPIFRLYYTTDVVGAELSGALKNVVAIACGMCLGCPKFNVPADAPKKLHEIQEKVKALPGLTEQERKELVDKIASKEIIDASVTDQFVTAKGGKGLVLGPNATNFLLTRAWEDVRKMCVARGAKSETLLSLSGLGDLMLTCYGGESRNAKFGAILGAAAAAGTREEDASQANPTVKFVLSNPSIYPVCEGYWTSFALRDMATQLNLNLPVLSKICDVLEQKLDPRDLISLVMTEKVQPEFDASSDDKASKVVPATHLSESTGAQLAEQRRRALKATVEHDTLELTQLPKPETTALVMIEFQNEFASPGGKMHTTVSQVMDHTGMLKNAADLCDDARKAGCRIIHVPISLAADSSDNPNQNLGILKACKDNALFTIDSWNADFVPGMKPRTGDLIVKNKKGLDAFPGSNLQELLDEHGVKTIVLGGFLTSCCVESTMRHAYELGYNVITLTDCTADTSMDAYNAATNGTFKLFSTPMTSTQFKQHVLP